MDWTDEAKARLEADISGEPFDGVYLLTRQRADIRAALEEIERRGLQYPDDLGISRDAAGLSARCAELRDRLVAQGKRAEAAEARLAEAERIVGLQNAALDVWKGAYPSDDSIHLAALAVAQGDRRLRVALEQIDRETRSASDVGLLRMGSIARAALRGER